MRYAFGQCRLDFVHQFLIEHIALGNCQHPLFVQHFRIECTQFVQQDIIFFTDIITVRRNHKQQQGVAFDMTQETESQTFTLTGSLDNSRNVRHYKRFPIMIGNDTQIRFECRKRIIGNLRFGSRNGRKQGRLSRIRESYQTDVGK